MDDHDRFAALAMHALIMRLGGGPGIGNDHDGCLTHLAEGAFAMADAMVKVRAERNRKLAEARRAARSQAPEI